jgi:glucosamine kinase
LAQDIFIGIDGGGTQSKVRVENSTGNLLGQAISGPANIRLSVDEAWRSIYTALEKILKPLAISLADKNYHFHAGLGLAGCEIIEAARAFLNRAHFFKSIQLVSDAHAACIGAHQGEAGAIIIAGTGLIGYQMEAGQSSRVSGWGFPHDDEGGGAWLGLQAIRLTLQWLDQRRKKSPLVEDIFAYFEQDQAKLVAWANDANSSEFARLAPIVINHSQQQEAAAVRLMKKAAYAIDRVAYALKKMRRHQPALPCCLLGGIAPFIEPWLRPELRSTFVARRGDASMGAILMLRQQIAIEG